MHTNISSTTKTGTQVVVFRELPPDQLARIKARYLTTTANPRDESERSAFIAALPEAVALIGSSYVLTPALLDTAPHLRVISSISAGVDNYPIDYLRNRGIILCHTPGVLTETTADLIFGLILATSRRIVELAQFVRTGQWTHNIGSELYGTDVHGKTLGIFGMGRIGQAVAHRAALGFGMPVLYHNRHVVPALELGVLAHHAQAVDRETLLRKSDFVVCTLPLTRETCKFMNAETFALMREGAIFINGSRGGVVDEDALLRALNNRRVRAAGLDVFCKEPIPAESPLRTHPRVVPLPHAGSATHETRHAMAALAVDNLLATLAGQPPADCVAT